MQVRSIYALASAAACGARHTGSSVSRMAASCAVPVSRTATLTAVQLTVRSSARAATGRSFSVVTSEAAAGASRGAPFTTSIRFAPVKSSVAGADQFHFDVTAPGLHAAQVAVFSRDTLRLLADQLAEKTGAKDVQFIMNGTMLTAEQLPRVNVSRLFGSCVDVQLDGLRYSVNEGRRITAMGSAAKQSLATSYIFIGAGAVITVVSCFAFWRILLPKERQRI
jgi:hypothetical protein